MAQIVDKASDVFVKGTWKFERIPTDTLVFRLHYKLAVWLVGIYSIVYSYLSFTKPISCFGAGDEVGKDKSINDYCWSEGTFTIPKSDPLSEIYHGISPYSSDDPVEVREQQQYKWMYTHMFIMTVLLLIPRYVWRWFENGNMSRLLDKLHRVYLIGKDEALAQEKDKLVNYLTSHLGYHRRYAFGFIFGEVLNVGVSSVLLWLWESITEHEISSTGGRLSWYLEVDPPLGTSPLAKVFPVLGKCIFSKHGPGGNKQPLDFLCVLPRNVINQPAAIFFWYFFLVLLTIGLAALVFRLLTILSVRVRVFLLSELSPMTSMEDLTVLAGSCDYSDWFIIYQMGKVLEPLIFQEVVKGVVRKLKMRIIVEV